MTIFTRFDPKEHPDNTLLETLGWIDYPRLEFGGGYGPTDPNWRIQSGELAYTPKSAGAQLYERALYDCGTLLRRGQARFEFTPAGAGFEPQRAVLLAKDDRNFLFLERTYFANYLDIITDVYNFRKVVGGIVTGGVIATCSIQKQFSDPAFDYFANVRWDVSADGTTLRLYVNGKLVPTNTAVTDIPIPVEIQGATKGGYFAYTSSSTRYATPMTLRDQSDLLEVTGALAVRHDATTSKIKLSGYCDKAGTTTVRLGLVDLNGAEVAYSTATVGGDHLFEVSAGPVPKRMEPIVFKATLSTTTTSIVVTQAGNYPLRPGMILQGNGILSGVTILSGPADGGVGTYAISRLPTVAKADVGLEALTQVTLVVTTVDGGAETAKTSLNMPVTIPQIPTRIGQNVTPEFYYNGYWPWRDLARGFHWRPTQPASGFPGDATIVEQLSGTPGGLGTYRLSKNATLTPAVPVPMIVGTYTRIVSYTSGSNVLTVTDMVEGGSIALGSTLWKGTLCRHPWSYKSLPPFAPDWWHSSYLGLQDNGSPTKFPSDGATIYSQMPWFLELGDYVLDISQAPDLAWTLTGDTSKFSITYDFYGPKVHRLRVTGSSFTNWQFNIWKNTAPGVANGGLPTTPWLITCVKEGTDPKMMWTDSLLAWYAESGLDHIRVMQGQAIDPHGNAGPNSLTALTRRRLESQTWGNCYQACFASGVLELWVQLCNHLNLDMKFNIPKQADESYVREAARIFKGLKPGLKVSWRRSNEVWNFGQNQYFGYQQDGFRRGLGKADAVFGADNGSYVFPGPDIPTWGAGLNFAADAKTDFDFNLYRAKVAIAADADNKNPQIDSARWELWQVGDRATARAYIEDTLRTREWLVSEYGGEAAFNARCEMAVEGRQDNISLMLDDMVSWGNAHTKIKSMDVGAYYGGTCWDWADARMPTDLRAAIRDLSGPTRTQAFVDAMKAQIDSVAAQFQANSLALRSSLIKAGADEWAVRMGSYEGGQHYEAVLTSYWINSHTDFGPGPTDITSLFNDYYAFFNDRHDELFLRLYGKLAEQGGAFTHFESFYPWDNFTGFISNGTSRSLNLARFFGVSKRTTDRASTSSMYRGLQQAGLTYAGNSIKDPTWRRKRRQPPAFLS